MCEAFDQQTQQPDIHDLSFEERFALLVERELLHRENRRLTRLLQIARLRENACVKDIDYRHQRSLNRSRMASLANGQWIHQAHNLVITGPTGCGKTWLACALGNQACATPVRNPAHRTRRRLLPPAHANAGQGSAPHPRRLGE